MKLTKRYLSRDLVTKPSYDKEMLREVWGDYWGASNEIGRIGKILMHRPGREVLHLHRHVAEIEAGPVFNEEVKGNTPSDYQQEELPALKRLQSQYDGLTQALKKEGIEVLSLDEASDGLPERMFTRDLAMVIPGGVVLSRPALHLRYGETPLATRTFAGLGIPILGMVQGTGLAEGGSFMMLDPATALIGRSERVNPAGIEQIRFILSLQQIRLLVIDLPSTIIHLDEAFMPIDHHKALVNTALLPFWFLDELHQRDIELLHVDPKDPPLTINALTLEPGRVLFSSSGARTMDLLAKHGIDFIPVEVDEIYKLGGGIHCVTLPLTRSLC
ncbi:dimethylarginine dimethylaminohydrolase family protein [Paenibacillus silviterrae]|uniref:dimethylarginine dimethylaminohydrolase family protein n=1 Tax=Paenibacillus silviterrae TaxID=3242194 RepID=UPI0025439A1C|nr:arginine deiminase family protein [Paenibacillus chinjuensis]